MQKPGGSERTGAGPARLNLLDQSAQRVLHRGGEEWDDGYVFTAPVTAFADGASPYGCLNMVGNITEWVADFYIRDQDGRARVDPRGPREGLQNVVKSGSFGLKVDQCTTAFRDTYDRSVFVGFRVARDE